MSEVKKVVLAYSGGLDTAAALGKASLVAAAIRVFVKLHVPRIGVAVSGFFRFLAKVGDGMMKMQIVKIRFGGGKW